MSLCVAEVCEVLRFYNRPILSDDINKTVHGQSTKIVKCGGIRGHESPRAGTPQDVYPVSVGQAKIQLTGP